MDKDPGGRMIPEDYRIHFERHKETIRRRLLEFRAVPRDEYLWELCYCLLTPGSRALHAERVIARLREHDFLAHPFDPTPILREPGHYIRFHNRKGERLLAMLDRRREILSILDDAVLSSRDRRERLVATVSGLGWKEASHFLRNIGCHDLAIIDRHILRHLHRCGMIDVIPAGIGSRGAYLRLEELLAQLADRFGLSLQELDLLFWSLEEGSVRK